MAVVYRAQDMMLERPVAIKLLRQDYSNNENFREQFRREARAAANLSHPNIVTVHDFGYDAGRLFIVMEFVDGDDLKNVIRAKGRFTVPEAIHLMSQACAGIGYAGSSTSPTYQNSMSAYMSKSVNLSGLSSASLSFWYKTPSMESGNYDHLRAYIDSLL